jgi:putative ABC transport system permease protein
MLLGEIIAAALASIRANALRSVLTMLGIVIGVGAVITMLALGSGAQKAVEDRIAALGANVFTVFAGQGRSGVVRISDATILSTDDYAALQRDATLLSAVVPEMAQNTQVKYGNQNANLQIVGTTPEYLPVRNYTVPYGRMFTAGDNAARRRYAVLGASVPRMLGGNPAAMINQTLDIGGVPFEIIGVLSEKGAAGGFMNPDEQILIPLNTGQ